MGLEDYFHSTRCADETQSKPHPQMLSELLDEFAVGPEAAVMIGDTEYDMDMARQLSMPRIAVSYGAHHIDRLRPFDPVMCLDQMDQLLEWRGG
jgi:phosphoglycolate phosphatase